METNEISIHQIGVFDFVAKAERWVTSKDIAVGAGVAERTARAHALKLVKLGILEQATVFPGHRYELSDVTTKRANGFLDRLAAAREVFNMELRT